MLAAPGLGSHHRILETALVCNQKSCAPALKAARGLILVESSRVGAGAILQLAERASARPNAPETAGLALKVACSLARQIISSAGA